MYPSSVCYYFPVYSLCSFVYSDLLVSTQCICSRLPLSSLVLLVLLLYDLLVLTHCMYDLVYCLNPIKSLFFFSPPCAFGPSLPSTPYTSPNIFPEFEQRCKCTARSHDFHPPFYDLCVASFTPLSK